MTTMDGTVPRPPAAVSDGGSGGLPDWRPWLVSLLVAILVAIPVVFAWTVGFTARCIALVFAAVEEAYATGRGPRE